MNKDAERRVRSCYECQIVSQPSVPEPMVRTDFPEAPWEAIDVDLLGPLPDGRSILVVVDYYSRYFETAILRSTVTTKVIEVLEDIFARYGLPKSLRADNGPQFAASEFKEFLDVNNIKLIQTIPLWPQANGEVERQNRKLLKTLKIAHAQKKRLKTQTKQVLDRVPQYTTSNDWCNTS